MTLKAKNMIIFSLDERPTISSEKIHEETSHIIPKCSLVPPPDQYPPFYDANYWQNYW